MSQFGFKELNVAVVGGGIGGLAAAVALRRAGHRVTIYERAHYAGEVGASISCAANGTRFLHEWEVNVKLGKPVVLQKLIWRDWKTSEPLNVYDLTDYGDKWGYVYNMFHRVDMHAMLMEAAVGEGKGAPAKLIVDHRCTAIDVNVGEITFENGFKATHDLIVGADGIGSAVRTTLGIIPEKKQSTSTCYHCIIPTERVQKLGLKDLTVNSAIEYWGGLGIEKIVYSPCREKQINSFYCFFPTEKSNHYKEGWKEEATKDQLLAPFPDLDPDLLALFENSEDIKPWRLFVHQPYPLWQAGNTCILGDAAHPMMPDQSQGACQALEDAGALGIIFSKDYGFTANIREGLQLYEAVRKPRATRVQSASAKARTNINERIGFSSNVSNPKYKVSRESEKLTIEEMNMYDPHIDIRSKARELGDGPRL